MGCPNLGKASSRDLLPLQHLLLGIHASGKYTHGVPQTQVQRLVIHPNPDASPIRPQTQLLPVADYGTILKVRSNNPV